MEWPIVLLVELAGKEIEALTRALQQENVLVLTEGSMLRAAMHVTQHRPQVVVAPSSLPMERTHALRDAARDSATEFVLVGQNGEVGALRTQIVDALARAVARRAKK